jgi:ubiquinone/menaquinone biosynthesis C-methylase UbiE
VFAGHAEVVDLGFRGDVAECYRRYRRGYPPGVISGIVEAFTLADDDVVVDLGCGTGQLAVPMAGHVGAVIGIDPEPDMLAQAAEFAKERGVGNVSWLVGTDADLATLIAGRTVGAVTIGQALHWMDHEVLFATIARLVRPGGGVAVLSNGIPLWQQDSDWSRALCAYLSDWLGTPLTRTCGTDAASRLRYANALRAAGLAVREHHLEYVDELDVAHIVGGVFSALSPDQLPAPDQRADFTARIADMLAPHAPFRERVPVHTLIGACRGG